MHQPVTEQIVLDLQSSATRLGDAGRLAANAAVQAERVQARSGRTGFRGIAQGMAQTVAMLKRVCAQVATLGQSVQNSAAAMRETADAPNPEQVKAKLTAAANEVRTARDGADGVLTDLAQIRSHIVTVLRGGKPERLIAMADGAKQAVAQAAGYLGSAQQRIGEAANEAEQIGAGALGGTGSAPVSADAGSGGDIGTGGSGDGAIRPVPDWIGRIAARLTVPPGSKVAGIAATGEGKELTKEPIVNGTRGQIVNNAATLRTDLVPWAWRGNVGLTHVEGHVAAIMRKRGGPRDVSLVITRAPCGEEFGCDATLRKMLPPDSVLTVYVQDENGVPRYYDMYDGTGEGVKE